MKALLTKLITLYQLTLSLMIGRQCRFYPTCSEYTKQAINQYGALTGTWLGIKRIGRCQPWCEGGYDPVPDLSDDSKPCCTGHPNSLRNPSTDNRFIE